MRYPGTARHQRAAITPAECARACTAILPGAPVLSRAHLGAYQVDGQD